MNSLETNVVEDSINFSYFDVQNLVIDHSFSNEEIESIKDLVFSPNNLQQIYFKGDCDYKTIELVKNLLTISDYAVDSAIEKYILIDLTPKELLMLLSSTFKNPSTWNVPYSKNEDTYELTDIPRYRTLNTFIRKLFNGNLSQTEQIMKVYDEIKLFEFDTESTNTQLPDIVSDKKTNSYGFNFLFTYILKSFGYKTSIAKIDSKGEESYISLVEVNDPKYNIYGLYIFDPSMDNLPKEKYDNNDIRRVNYNYFMLPLSVFLRNKYGDSLTGALSLLAIDDLKYSEEKKENCKSNAVLKEVEQLLKVFNIDYSKLHEKLKNSKPISIEQLLEMVTVLYQNKLNDIIKDNYLNRKEELFSKDTEEELNSFVEKEK